LGLSPLEDHHSYGFAMDFPMSMASKQAATGLPGAEEGQERGTATHRGLWPQLTSLFQWNQTFEVQHLGYHLELNFHYVYSCTPR
jgi:hypothetical protein